MIKFRFDRKSHSKAKKQIEGNSLHTIKGKMTHFEAYHGKSKLGDSFQTWMQKFLKIPIPIIL